MNSALFWSMTLLYVALTAYLGYLGWKRTRGSEDFMLAGRKVRPWVIGLSYGATFISTSAIVGFGGMSAKLGMGLMFLVALNIGVGVLLAFIAFGKRTRELGQKLGAVTFPDLLGKRYGSNGLHLAMGVLILISMPLYAAAVLIGGSQFLSITLGIDYNVALLIFAAVTAIYVVMGGLTAVMYTEAMQGVIMVVGMVILLGLTFWLLGGVTEANTALTDLSATPGVPADLAAQGMTGWTTMPDVGSSIWFTLVTTVIMGVGIGALAQPQLAVRFMTAKDSRTLTRAIPIGAVFILLTAGIAYTVGALSNVWFFREHGAVAWTYPGNAANVDTILPNFINGAMPEAFVVAFMLVLLSAAMSTLSSIFHALGTSAGYDVWRTLRTTGPFRRDGASLDDKPSMAAARYGTAIMIVATVLLAFLMPSNIIARATAMFMGLCAGAFLPMYVMAMFSSKPSRVGAVASLAVGAASWFLWTVFVHSAEASQLGICKWLTGSVTVLGAPWTVVDPLIISLPLAAAALAVGTLWERRRSQGTA